MSETTLCDVIRAATDEYERVNPVDGAVTQAALDVVQRRMDEIDRIREQNTEITRNASVLRRQRDLAVEALERIRIGRPNRRFDPWARDIAREALWRLNAAWRDP